MNTHVNGNSSPDSPSTENATAKATAKANGGANGPPPPASPAASTRRVALIVAGAFFMMLLNGAILNTSLPLMAKSLGVTPLALTAGVTVYLLAAAAIIPASGWLADRWEARRVFSIAMAAFTLASLGCGLSQNLGQLVAARALQGVAAGLMAPVGRTLVLRNAAKSEVMAAIAMIVWPSLLAPVLGPPLGGFISTYASWHWNFFINLPVGLLGLYAVWRWVPRTPVPRPAALDWLGCLLCAAALVMLLLGFERGAQADTPLVLTVALLVASGAMRSMQMTSMNTVAFADIEPADRGAASTPSTMCSQMASALGAALGALTLALSQMAHGRSALAAVDFRVASGVMATFALIGVAGFGRLKPGDGAEVSGHRASGV